MGLKIGRFLTKAVRTVVPVAAGFAMGGPFGALTAGAGLLARRGPASSFAPIGAGIPSIQQVTGVSPFFVGDGELAGPGPQVQTVAGAMPAVVGTMTRTVAIAISRLAARLGIPLAVVSMGAISRVGMRIWGTVMAFARRHPGVSVIALLTGLGLAAEEAMEFLMWGHSKKKRRHRRGISGRDIRICRRTMRRMAAFHHDLARFAHHAPRRRAIGPGGVSVVRAG